LAVWPGGSAPGPAPPRRPRRRWPAPWQAHVHKVLVNVYRVTAKGLDDVACELMDSPMINPLTGLVYRVTCVSPAVPQRVEDDIGYRVPMAEVPPRKVGNSGRRAAIDPGGIAKPVDHRGPCGLKPEDRSGLAGQVGLHVVVEGRPRAQSE